MALVLMVYVVVNLQLVLTGFLLKKLYLKTMLVNVLRMKMFIGIMVILNVFLSDVVEKHGNALKQPLNTQALLAVLMVLMFLYHLIPADVTMDIVILVFHIIVNVHQIVVNYGQMSNLVHFVFHQLNALIIIIVHPMIVLSLPDNG
ncbi:putative ORFan [Cotonvirus japonicus]|uniref:ORFan n=1 Tax=Cotonvirus japonicus TaxID=2811091 RepID=A0ABM7NTI9_9VIRU|nr:putative ORFan [Cotonvirus japonicus]BCS83492.1 putative ORFan [Cotonvirus japonicus]